MEELLTNLPPVWQAVLYLTFIAAWWWQKTHVSKVGDKVTALAETAQAAVDASELVAAAVTPNHGSSMADAVNRIETGQNELQERITAIEARLDSLIATDTPCFHGGESAILDKAEDWPIGFAPLNETMDALNRLTIR